MILSPRDALLFSIATLTPEIAHSVVPVHEDRLPTWLYDWQFDMLLEAAALMRQGYRRILIQCPTGGGKTRMAAALMLVAAQMGSTSQFMVHRKELIKQTSKTFTEIGLPHGFIANGWPLSTDAATTLAGIQTLVNRLRMILPPDLVVVDECHHAVSATYTRVLNAYQDSFIIGLSATPERLDGRGLDEHFDVMVKGPSVSWLIENGYLSPFEFYGPDNPDMSGVPSTAGDFQVDAAAEVVDKPDLVGNIVEHYLRLAPGEQGLVFAVNREHSRHIAAEFNANGVPAMHVDGDTPDDERDYFDDAFRAGDIRMGVNVDLFGEGYDVPNISYVGDGGPSRSRVKVRQRWGRTLRIFKGKIRGIISDHAGNWERLGDLPDMDCDFSLQGRAKRSRGVSDDADPVRQCLQCYRVYPSFMSVCPGCGAAATPTKREIEQRDGDLKRIERAAAAIQKAKDAALRKAEEKACREYADFYHLAMKRGYGDQNHCVKWAKMKMKFRANAAARFRRGG